MTRSMRQGLSTGTSFLLIWMFFGWLGGDLKNSADVFVRVLVGLLGASIIAAIFYYREERKSSRQQAAPDSESQRATDEADAGAKGFVWDDPEE